MNLLSRMHGAWVHEPRVKVLASLFARLIPSGAKSLLDVGCGDGILAREIHELRPDIIVQGLDVFARPNAAIPVTVFDGVHLPFAQGEFDVIMFADVLHHTADPRVLLREAVRVAGQGVAIKDHLMQGFLASRTLAFMDWMGNAAHGVALPYNYWRPDQWTAAFRELDLAPGAWETSLRLYPWPARLLFERSLHFVAWIPVQPAISKLPEPQACCSSHNP
jgi:SAM-dependent methyltransferase